MGSPRTAPGPAPGACPGQARRTRRTGERRKKTFARAGRKHFVIYPYSWTIGPSNGGEFAFP